MVFRWYEYAVRFNYSFLEMKALNYDAFVLFDTGDLQKVRVFFILFSTIIGYK